MEMLHLISINNIISIKIQDSEKIAIKYYKINELGKNSVKFICFRFY